MGDVVVYLRGAQQCLCGNAPPVQTDPTKMLALDQRSLQAKLRRADGSDITARTAANDDDVETRFGHDHPLFFRQIPAKAASSLGLRQAS